MNLESTGASRVLKTRCNFFIIYREKGQRACMPAWN